MSAPMEYLFILPEQQQEYLDAGWTIRRGKEWGGVWNVIAVRRVAVIVDEKADR